MSSDPIEVLLDKAAALEKVLPVAREYAHAPEVREFREALAAALASLSAPKPESAEARCEATHCCPSCGRCYGCAKPALDHLAQQASAPVGVECNCPGEGKTDPSLHAPNCPVRLAQQPAACDMGALCIGCEPRNADGSCPGQQPAAVDEAMVERAAEAAWLEFKSGLEQRSWERAPAVRKDRLRIIVRTALTAAQQQGGES